MAEGGEGTGADVVFKFGASISELTSKIDEIGNYVTGLANKFAVLAGVVAGGSMFKSFIDEAASVNKESERMSRQLGISTEETSALSTALGDIGSSTDVYVGAFTKFNRMLRSNSEDMKKMGVDVDSLKNGTKTSNQVFMDSIKILAQYKPGVDQTQAAMHLFGARVGDVTRLLRLHKEVLEEARKKNEELNLTVTSSSLAAYEKYRAAISDVHDVIKGISKTIGEELMPVFTASSKLFASYGPMIVSGFKILGEFLANFLTRVGATFVGLKDAVLRVVSSIAKAFGVEGAAGIDTFTEAVQLLQDVFYALMDGVDIVVSAVADVLSALASPVAELITQVVNLGNSFTETGNAASDAANTANPFVLLGEAIREIFRVVAVVIANVIFVIEGVGRELGAVAAQVVELSRQVDKFLRGEGFDLDSFHAISDAVKADGVRARAELDALERRIMGIKDIDAAGGGRGFVNPDRAQLSPKLGHKEKGEGDKNEVGDKGFPFKDRSADALLKAQEALERARLEAAFALEKEYNSESMAAVEDLYKNKLITTEQYYYAKRELMLQDNAAEVAMKEKEKALLETERGKAEKEPERVKIDAQIAKLNGEINVLKAKGLEITKQTSREEANLTTAEQQKLNLIKAQTNESAVGFQIERERKIAQAKVDNLEINEEQILSMEAEWENRRYEAQLERLRTAGAQLKDKDEEARAAWLKEVLDAYYEHNNKILAADQALFKQQHALQIQAVTSIKGAFKTMFDELFTGTVRLSTAFANLGKGILEIFKNMIAQRLADKLFEPMEKAISKMVEWVWDGLGRVVKAFITSEAEKTAATGAGAAERTTIEAAAEATSTSLTIGGTIKAIGAKAWQAAANVYAAISEIPLVGPFLAPAMAIAASAAVLGFIGRIAGAKGGWWQIPSDQIANVHANEMVLPAAEAQGLRELIGSGGRGGDTHLHIHATDAQSVERLFKNNGKALVEVLRKQRRNFAF